MPKVTFLSVNFLLLCSMYRQLFSKQELHVLHRIGDDAVFHWYLPESLPSVIAVSLKRDNNFTPVFYGSTETAGTIYVYEKFRERVSILNSLSVTKPQVSFTLEDVQLADAGQYVCLKGNARNVIDNCGQMLVIIDPPTDTEIVATDLAVENYPLVLECRSISQSHPSDHGLPMQIDWSHSLLGSRARKDGVSLVISSVRREDSGFTFQCRASDGLGVWSNTSQQYVIKAEYGPTMDDIYMNRSEVTVVVGHPLLQSCSASCNPDCSVSWEKQSSDQWFDIGMTASVFEDAYVSRDESGLYRCLAENRHGFAFRQLAVDVQYAPKVQSCFMNDEPDADVGQCEEGQDVTLSCRVDSNPAPVVLWYRVGRDGDQLLFRDESLRRQQPVFSSVPIFRHLYRSRLLLTGVQCSHAGTFRCSASNSVGAGLDVTFKLEIMCVPRNFYGELSLRQVYVSPWGQDFKVTFQVEAFPQPVITHVFYDDEKGARRSKLEGEDWSSSTYSIAKYPQLTTFELYMYSPTLDCTYFIQVENSQGSEIMAFLLREQGPPKPPINLAVVSTTRTSAMLSWLPGFHGGSPQSFVVTQQRITDGAADDDALMLSVDNRTTQQHEPEAWKFVLRDLEPGLLYSVRVFAINEFGNSSAGILVELDASVGRRTWVVAGSVIALLCAFVLLSVLAFLLRSKRCKCKSFDVEDGSSDEEAVEQTTTLTGVTPPDKTVHHCEKTHGHADGDRVSCADDQPMVGNAVLNLDQNSATRTVSGETISLDGSAKKETSDVDTNLLTS